MARLYNKREEAQLRRCVALLERIRYERTTEEEQDDDTHPAYHAAVAIYGLEDLMEAVEREDQDEKTNALARLLVGENVVGRKAGA